MNEETRVEKTTQKLRNSRFEIVKILCIFGIIFSHYATHGMASMRQNVFSLNEVVLNLITIGNICVTIFMMMTGFFLVNSKSFSLTKLLKIIFQVIFYSLMFMIIELIMTKNLSAFSIYEYIFSLFMGKQWFVGCYIIVYSFHPFINKMLKSLTPRGLNVFVIIMFFFTSIITTLPFVNFYVNELVSLTAIYCFGAYLYLKKESKWMNKKNALLLILASFALLITSTLILSFLGTKVSFFENKSSYFLGRNSIFVIPFSLGVTMICYLSTPFYSRIINFVSSFSLGIYLIHDNCDFSRELIWNKLLKTADYYGNNLMVIHLFISCLLVFLICLLIDLIRRYCLEYPLFKIIGKRTDKAFFEIE